MLLAIDPGTTHSAYVMYEDGKPHHFGIEENKHLLNFLRIGALDADFLYIEMVASYGMPVGATVFETCVWTGRFIEAWSDGRQDWQYVYRKDVKMHLCGSHRAKDANIRQAIMDRYGSDRKTAIGTKKAPGPLYGFKKDIWAAMAVAITADET